MFLHIKVKMVHRRDSERIRTPEPMTFRFTTSRVFFLEIGNKTGKNISVSEKHGKNKSARTETNL